MTDLVDRPLDAARAERPPLAVPAVAVIAVVSAAVLVFSASRYGYFGDELYFLAAGRRPAWGYADQGPVLPLVARLMDVLAPGSYLVLRLPAVTLTVAAIVLCAMLAREFGGGRAAQVLAAVGYASSPFLLLQGAMLTTNAVDTALWVIITWLLVRWVRTRRDVLLLAAALVTVVDFQVKWLIPFLWVALAATSLVFGPRDLVRRPLLWLGGAVVVVSAIPELLWQARHDWPQLSMGTEIAGEQDVLGGKLMFVPMSVMVAGLLGAPLLLFGLWVLLRWKSLRDFRFLGATLLVLFLVFMVTGGRIYYSAGMYGVVIAAGAVGVVTVLRQWRPRWRYGASAVVIALAAWALAVTLNSTSWRPADEVAPPRDDAEAALAIGVYGRFGSPELDDAVTAAYDALPPDRREHTVIITDTYWQASALDQLGRDDLPPIYSPSRGFGYFGTPPDDADVLAVGGYEAVLRTQFEHVEPVGKLDTRLGFPGNTQNVTIWKCTDQRKPWSQVWPTWLHL
ncbi:glycosyltransferase family 39 protein [Nocardia mexicana]|uniref:Dolichyl-phosphate-mannose-protein mannosyltransferase n=1 Tax=Nocardia mexicana TaxID=279262 RepID=A0A370H3W9_9NOCA|nr:glycosyltransferase family 39 protein [Nocardia mexicana]RDI50886.1 dolichyl-phosphate-mannose-protein mannosyltransferase [Nocardia mexicana]